MVRSRSILGSKSSGVNSRFQLEKERWPACRTTDKLSDERFKHAYVGGSGGERQETNKECETPIAGENSEHNYELQIQQHFGITKLVLQNERLVCATTFWPLCFSMQDGLCENQYIPSLTT